MSLPTIEVECQLLDWSETAKGGAKIVLQLPDPDALAPFRTMTLAKRGAAGQRLMAVFVEIGDDEQPEKPKGGPLSILAAQWCNDPRFVAWLYDNYPASCTRFDGSADSAADCVRVLCHVRSRAELDHDEVARVTFDRLIRIPYRAYLQEQGE